MTINWQKDAIATLKRAIHMAEHKEFKIAAEYAAVASGYLNEAMRVAGSGNPGH